MLNTHNNEAFSKKWEEFFNAIKKAGNSEIEKGDKTLRKLKSPFEQVIDIIVEKNTTKYIDKEINRLRAEDHGDVMINALFAEMDFVVSLVESSKKPAKETIAAGQTVKGSIESLFDPPRWVKKILKVLNELLSLIRGGA